MKISRNFFYSISFLISMVVFVFFIWKRTASTIEFQADQKADRLENQENRAFQRRCFSDFLLYLRPARCTIQYLDDNSQRELECRAEFEYQCRPLP